MLWFDSYRPKNPEQLLVTDAVKEKLRDILDSGETPNLILHGGPGQGKSSFAKIVISNLDCIVLPINASDENGIDTIRDKIKQFVYADAGMVRWKIVLMEEANRLTPDAQETLRFLTEEFVEHSRFIFTSNTMDSFIPALLSRFQVVHVEPADITRIARRFIEILDAERIKYDRIEALSFVERYYPDIRRLLNEAQGASSTGTLRATDASRFAPWQEKVLNLILNDGRPDIRFTQVRHVIYQNNVVNFDGFFTYIYQNLDRFSPENRLKATVILDEHSRAATQCLDRELNTVACITKLLQL